MPLVRPANPYRLTRPAGPPGQWSGPMRPNMPQSGMPPYANLNAAMQMGQPDISQQRVPDEILTPEQRQHRKGRLDSLRKIQEMLFSGGDQSDFKHINMAQEGPYVPPNSQSPGNTYSMGQLDMAPGPMFNESIIENPNNVEQKPPPPYPVPMPSPGSTAIKKNSRKRKNSSLPSPSPSSPHGQNSIKSEKMSIPPSPLANPNMNSSGGPLTPQPTGHVTPQPTVPAVPQVGGPKTPQPLLTESSGTNATMMPPIARQNSMPNFPLRNGGQPPYHMLQAGHPTPYQVSIMSPPQGMTLFCSHQPSHPCCLLQSSLMAPGGEQPPSYNPTMRRGMSVESITAPPSHRQQYLQPENQERIIERQLNISHQTSMGYQSYSEQQTLYSNASHGPISVSSSHESSSNLNSITSASLANLAKGVEENISQISQKTPQQPGSFTDNPTVSSNSMPNTDKPSSQANPTSSSQHMPSVNNTYVNTHMSIGQVNIQNVTANQSYQGPGMPNHMQQNVDVRMNNYNGGMMPQPDPMYKPPQAAPAVSIQNKGRNTIQYLPVSQPSLPPTHEPVIPSKQTFEFGSDRYPSPSQSYFPDMPAMCSQPSSRHTGHIYSSQLSHPSQGQFTHTIHLIHLIMAP